MNIINPLRIDKVAEIFVRCETVVEELKVLGLYQIVICATFQCLYDPKKTV